MISVSNSASMAGRCTTRTGHVSPAASSSTFAFSSMSAQARRKKECRPADSVPSTLTLATPVSRAPTLQNRRLPQEVVDLGQRQHQHVARVLVGELPFGNGQFEAGLLAFVGLRKDFLPKGFFRVQGRLRRALSLFERRAPPRRAFARAALGRPLQHQQQVPLLHADGAPEVLQIAQKAEVARKRVLRVLENEQLGVCALGREAEENVSVEEPDCALADRGQPLALGALGGGGPGRLPLRLFRAPRGLPLAVKLRVELVSPPYSSA